LWFVKRNELNQVAVQPVFVAGHIVVFLSVQLVRTEDIKEVPHYGSPQGRERLTTNRNDLPLVLGAVIENNPEQDIVCLPAPSSSLLYCYALVALQ
jgi:hypothetical protein